MRDSLTPRARLSALLLVAAAAVAAERNRPRPPFVWTNDMFPRRRPPAP